MADESAAGLSADRCRSNLEKRLEQTEELVEKLRSLLGRATDALEEYHALDGTKHEDAPCDVCPPIVELRMETAQGIRP